MTKIEDYIRPESIQDAETARRDVPGAVYLAGGTQVNRAPLESPRPGAVIDLRGVVSDRISMDGADLVIGAMASLQDLADFEEAPEALRRAADFIPTRSIRNQATVGGNIAAGRPDSYLIPAFIALAAQVRTPEGTFPVEEYVFDGHDALILEIRVPAPLGPCEVVKESRSHIALPVVSAAVSLAADDSHGLAGACLAVGCAAKRTIRLTEVEEALVKGELTDRAELEAAISKAVNPRSDVLGSTEYKKYINGVVIAEAVMRCREALA